MYANDYAQQQQGQYVQQSAPAAAAAVDWSGTEAAEGVRFSWNVVPSSRIDATNDLSGSRVVG